MTEFRDEIKEARERARDIVSTFNLEQRMICSYRDVLTTQYFSLFVSKGEEFTSGYLEGNRGRILNIFSTIYEGAQAAQRRFLARKGGSQ